MWQKKVAYEVGDLNIIICQNLWPVFLQPKDLCDVTEK